MGGRFNNPCPRGNDDVKNGKKFINILQACQAHLSGPRWVARPLTHMIAWAAVHFLSLSVFPLLLSPRNCLFAMLLLSIVNLDEGEVWKKKEEARDAERGAAFCERNTVPQLLKKKKNN